MKGKVIFAVLLSISFSSFATERSPHWSYEGSEDPAHWGKLSPDFSLCETGKNQSPVNIQGVLKSNHGKLELAFQQGKQQIVNNGHTIQVNVSEGNTLRLDNDTFTLQQFHFHAPSENEIDGKQFPLEAHFVYKDKNGALAVLAQMFQQGKSNPQLAKAWQQIPTAVDQTAVLNKPLDIKALLPKQFNFYRFSGSLTTPPCSEGVRWIVLEQPVSASTEQINQFRSAIHHANNRPIQPLNGRIIIN
ncbi:carbonic anhydrase family protein (plasmid) [Citrobacter freundii]|uniref:carbonic anhydrase n=1 Tax=Enterobacterales TaxID=91347 RepID=UPI00075E4793|nr:MULTISPECIES: carbonic anhydrase family protein [Enterobacterales]KVJ63661.1 carbonic anhydrase [Enterobacter hormaechei subsp. steigerwaltii]MCT9614367.1 carbonic anhydrase family protein [Escherichia coli]MCT9619747.1 carbonic anhydrase family protein [Escherichia coli]TBL64172.1 carbonic anhydrase family protein [Hafnia paralvei]UZQ92504.1 carbonic anhydrase family protein [Citrobacter freundii]